MRDQGRHAVSAGSSRTPGPLRLARGPFLSLSVLPVLLALVLARRAGAAISWSRAMLTLAGVASAHAAANLLNDFFDFRSGADPANRRRTPLSGGSPFLVSGAVSPRRVLGIALLFGLLALYCWWALATQVDGGWGPISWLALAGGILGLLYTMPPVRLAYRTLGEAAIMLVFGPLVVGGAYYVQTGRFTPLVWLASGFPGLLAGTVILVNEIPDVPADAAAGKLTLPVRWGWPAAVRLFAVVNLAGIIVALLTALATGKPAVGAASIAPVLNLLALPLLLRRGGSGRIYPAQVLTVAMFHLGLLAMIAALLP